MLFRHSVALRRHLFYFDLMWLRPERYCFVVGLRGNAIRGSPQETPHQKAGMRVFPNKIRINRQIQKANMTNIKINNRNYSKGCDASVRSTMNIDWSEIVYGFLKFMIFYGSFGARTLDFLLHTHCLMRETWTFDSTRTACCKKLENSTTRACKIHEI